MRYFYIFELFKTNKGFKMKKLVLILIITIFSCSSDDSTTESLNDPILGRWGAYKSINDSNGETEYFVPYDGVAMYNADGTFIQSFFDTQAEGTWENLGDNTYSFNIAGIQTQGEIQFVGDSEFVTNEFDETDHFRNIESDTELRDKIIGTWGVLNSCNDTNPTSNSTTTFNPSGNGQIINPDATINPVTDITWEISNGSLYVSLVDFPNTEPSIGNIVFESNDRMRNEFISNEFTVQCLVRLE